MDPREFLESNLTKSQYFIWAGQKMNPKDPLYNAALTFDIFGQINIELFRSAFQSLISHCDTLRTVFTETEGIPRQTILKVLHEELEIIDLSQHEHPLKESERIVDKRKVRLIDISKKIFESFLIKIDDNRFIWFLNVHHLVTDAWSSSVLFHTMSAIYSSLIKGAAPKIEIYPFSQYRVEEKRSRNQENINQVSYWHEKADRIETVSLYGNQPGYSTVTRKLKIDFGDKRSSLVKELAKSKPFLSFNLDLAIYNIFSTLIFGFLHKISQQQDISFGTPTHNRTTPELKKSPGLFIEFFPLQTVVNENDNFISLFTKVRNEVNGFLKNVKPGISMAEVNRRFNVLFNYTNFTFGKFSDIETKTTYHSVGHNDPRHDLVIQINDFDGSGIFNVEFDLSLEEENEVIYEFVPDQFLLFFDQIIANPELPIDKIGIVDVREREYLLNSLNKTDLQFDKNYTLIDLFLKSAQQFSNLVVAKQGDTKITFDELDILSSIYAQKLIEKDISKGDIVAICLERSIEMLISMVAIQKAGAAYLPIEPSYPLSRIKFMITNSQAALVISSISTIKNCELDQWNYINIDVAEYQTFKGDKIQINRSDPESPAYVIYTSGSTGNPKGVVISHKSIYNRVLWMQHQYPITPDDKILQKTPYTFDVSVWEFFWPLITGATLVFTKPDGHKDPNYLRDLIISEQITTIHFVPSMMAEFLQIRDLGQVRSLKYAFSSGEALTKKIHDIFLKTFSDCVLSNLYGPTEATVDVTYWKCSLDHQSNDIPIGKAVANTQLYILDDSKHLLPYGQSGNLFIGGEQVALGYINDPELTSAKFINNPIFKSDKNLYDTGDIARYRGDGILHYEGRKDHQIKISGLRIELGEIEAAILAHPAITNAAVLLDRNNTNTLVAFYTGEKLTNEEVRRHLRNILPEYMLPGTSHFVDQMPLTSSGKIDRKALGLSVKNSKEQKLEEVYVGPSNDLEDLIQQIWEEVFVQKQISIYADFLELGGHSLVAIRICSRILDTLDLKIPINMVFKYPTIAMLSNQIELIMTKILEDQSDI